MLRRYSIVYYEVTISISLDKRLGIRYSIYIYFFLLHRNKFLNSSIYCMRDRKVKRIQYIKEK